MSRSSATTPSRPKAGFGSRRSPQPTCAAYTERNSTKVSPRTVQYIHVTLNKALKQAVADGLIPRNICEAVKPPRPQKREIAPLSPEQARRFLEACRGERLEALFVFGYPYRHAAGRDPGAPLGGRGFEDWGARGASGASAD